ncbi:cell division protein ZapA [Pseudoalteromonas sp. MMG013]|uniref:cell division protein ZapA n=1 Tax=unclassified Pseudoalteromonas TaxID=194690 RepID=UPI001B3992CB|nr:MULTISPECIES: cell division protein ZapA [unclassified Pseudoalteromonas]MBQ4849405.1 cell division protein ZapA [Pseudoalteromonas sp. MMG012]MBQ4862345.1 cell division protein ZapA [Pseudoalteromonas sp. MMG013]
MSEKINQVDVTLLGKTHQFACSEGQENVLLDAANLLNERVTQMKQRATVRNEQNALLLAALYLCHDLQALEQQQQTHHQSQQILIDKLISHLEVD